MAIPTKFDDVLEILGGRKLQTALSDKHWTVYTVDFSTPAGSVRGNYLYLNSECPWSEASGSNRSKWRRFQPYDVVVTTKSRLAEDLSRAQKEFGGRSATTPRKLLIDNVVRGLNLPTRNTEDYKFFVEPEVRLEGDRNTPALTFLVNELTRNAQGGGLAQSFANVLVAPAGQGKTTLCRHIANRILAAHSDVIPVFVESAQWQDLINLSLKNVLNAALLTMIPDASNLTSEKTFRLLVREQILLPIFDGFDELSLHPGVGISPAKLLEDLLDILGDNEAAAVITVRENYWEKYCVSLPEDKKVSIRRLDLQGFSNNQRQRFFEKRLDSPTERDLANRLVAEISKHLYGDLEERTIEQRDRMSGLPLMLELVAMYVHDNPKATPFPISKDPLGPLLNGVCERENVRQKLDLNPNRQMEIFQEIFSEYPAEIPRDDVHLMLEMYAGDMSVDRKERFESHAFFDTVNPDLVRPRFEMLRVYFVAAWLTEKLELARRGEMSPQLEALLQAHADGTSDVFEFLIERFIELGEERANAAISHAYAMIKGRGSNWEAACSALVHLANGMALRSIDGKIDRTNYLIKLFSNRESSKRCFDGLSIEGQVSGLDFSEMDIMNCVFKNAVFMNCTFSDTTKFSKSRFRGTLNFHNCSGLKLVGLENCRLSSEAEDEWEKFSGRNKATRIVKETAVDAIRDILRKFVSQFGFSTVKTADMSTGAVSKNPCRNSAIDSLKAHGFIQHHHISGVSDGGYNVADDDDSRHEIRNLLDNAIVGKKLSLVVQEVLSKSS